MIRADTSKPFLGHTTDFMLWLSRREWQFCYSWTFAMQMLGECSWPTLGRAFRACIAEMQRVHGYSWDGIRADSIDRLWPTQEEPVEEGNLDWILLIQRGYPPDYALHMPVALDFAAKNLPDLDTEPLREAMHRAQAARETAEAEVAEILPDIEADLDAALQERLETLRPNIH